MGRSLGELQRELQAMREREEDRDKRTELSLEELENLIAAKEEDASQRFQQQAQENAENIMQVKCAERWTRSRWGEHPLLLLFIINNGVRD